MHHGVRMYIDYISRQWSKPYVNNTLFLEYINNIFITYLNKIRETEEFEACQAVLLMNNCSDYMPDDLIAILTREGVRVVIFATDMTQIFQILDMVPFGALKKYATGLETLDEGHGRRHSSSKSITISNRRW
jgi:hypothetical protein